MAQARQHSPVKARAPGVALACALTLALALALTSAAVPLWAQGQAHNPNQGQIQGQTAPRTLQHSHWVLAQMHGVSGPLPEVPLHWGDAQLTGTDGCNRVIVPYTELPQQGLRVDAAKGIATRMACMGVAGEVSARWSGLMAQVVRFRLSGLQLELHNAQGQTLLRYALQNQDLTAHTYRVNGYNNGQQAYVSVPADAALWLRFEANGHLHGFAGCSRFEVPYRHDALAQRLRVQADALMVQPCPAHSAVALQQLQQRVLAALAQTHSLSQEGTGMLLRSAQGAMQLGASALPPAANRDAP